MFTVAFDTVNTVISYLEIVPRGSDEDGGRPRVWRRHRGSQFGDVEGLLRGLSFRSCRRNILYSPRRGLFDIILHKILW